MGVFAPLYYAGGRYASITDRKLLAAMVGADIPTTDGDKITGVLYDGSGSTRSMSVTYSSKGNLSVAQGFCVVPDNSYISSTSSIAIGTGSKTFTITTKQNFSVGDDVKVSYNSSNFMLGKITALSFTSVTVNVTSVTGSGTYTSWQIAKTVQDGLYLAGFDSATTVTYSSAASTRNDTLYAVVDTTPYIITNKGLGTTGGASASNRARLTTSVAHGFVTGQYVLVQGVDEIFNGSYQITSVPSTTTFEYAKTNADIASTAVVPIAKFGATNHTVTNKAYDNTTGEVTLTTSASHGRSVGDFVTVIGVGREFDGTYALITGTTGSTLKYDQNRVFPSVSSVAITQSTVATAQVPFKIVVDEGNAGTYNSKARIKLATGVINTGATADVWTDVRRFSVVGGGVEVGGSSPDLTNAPGRFRITGTTLQYYTTSWNNFLTTGTSGTTASVASHTHSGLANVSHTHSFAATSHTHTLADVQLTDVVYYSNLPNAISSGFTSASETLNFKVLGVAELAAVSLNSAVPMYVLIQYQALRNSGTSNAVSNILQVDITGDTFIDEYVVSGTASNESAATDGTAYNNGDRAAPNSATWSGKLIGSRLVKVPVGNLTYTLKAYSSGPYSGGIEPASYISGATLRVIPIMQVSS